MIEVSTDGGGTWTQLATKAGDLSLWYEHTGLAAGAVRHYRVKGRDSVGGVNRDSAWSNTASATALGANAPAAPAGFQAKAADNGVLLSWNDPNDAAVTGYEYQQAEGGSFGTWKAIPGSGPRTTSHRVTGLTAGADYSFRLRAVKGAVKGLPSGGAIARAGAVVPLPGKPDLYGISASTSGSGIVTLTWNRLRVKEYGRWFYDETIMKWQVEVRRRSDRGATWVDIPDSGYRTTSHHVGGLQNGVEYIFRIRAVNASGAGDPSDEMAATPRWPADMVLKHEVRLANLSITPGDDSLKVAWSKLEGRTYCGYIIEWRAGGTGDWQRYTFTSPSHRPSTKITGLNPGTSYQVRVSVSSGYDNVPAGLAWERTVSTTGTSTQQQRSEPESVEPPAQDSPPAEPPPSDPLTARVTGAPDEHDGEAFTVRIAFSEDVATKAKDAAYRISGGTVVKARRVNERKDLWQVNIEPGGHGAVTLRLPAGAAGTPDGRALSSAVSVRVAGPPGLSVADTRVQEAEGAKAAFRVTLSRAATRKVTVSYATADGSAVAGEDYKRRSSTLTFRKGQTAKTVEVKIFDDAHDEGEETFTLRLSEASGAYLADAEGTGTIANTDPLPRGWLARFGRASAGQVLTLLDERFEQAGQVPGQLTLGGQAVDMTARRSVPNDPSPHDLTDARGYASDITAHGPLADYRPLPGRHDDPAGQFRQAGDAGESPPAGDATPMEQALWTLLSARGQAQTDTRAFLAQSRFHLPLAGAADRPAGAAVADRPPPHDRQNEESGSTLYKGRWSLWGRGALTHFGGQDSGVDLHGDVLTGLVGLDYARHRWLAGLALAYHDGEGTYTATRHAGAGDLDSALMTINPYLRYALTERVSVWGTAGYGTGTLTLRPERNKHGPQEAIETDMNLTMGALGLRGVVYAGARTELALKTDALWVRTASKATDGLQRASADTRRFRLLLAGQHQRVLPNDALLSPNVELGLRYDGGDAETGVGMELGGGLRYADARLGLHVETKARALLTHEDGQYREWGLSGSVSLDPGRLGRGLALRLDSGWGIAEGGAQALWERRSMAGMAAQQDLAAQGRFTAEAGYGLDVPWTQGILTPYGGMEWAGQSRTLRLGWRFSLGRQLSLSLDGEHREAPHAGPAYGVMLNTRLPW